MAFFTNDQLKEIVQFLKTNSKELIDVIANDSKLKAEVSSAIMNDSKLKTDLMNAVVEDIVKRLKN